MIANRPIKRGVESSTCVAAAVHRDGEAEGQRGPSSIAAADG